MVHVAETSMSNIPLNTNPHLQASLGVFGTPSAQARLAVILLHGRQQTPELMDEMIVRRVDLPGVAYFAPSAAESSWYPARFIEPLAQNEPLLGHALERIDVLSDELLALGFPYESQVVMGFSQGACLGCEYVWRRRRPYAALIAFTGGLIGPSDTVWDISQHRCDGLPVLLSSCAEDPWVPAERVIESYRVFRDAGADVALSMAPGSEHEIRDAEVDTARALLKKVLHSREGARHA